MSSNQGSWKLTSWLLVVVLLVACLIAQGYLRGSEVRLFALDAKTGRVEWSTRLDDQVISSPVAANGRVLVDVGSYEGDPVQAWELNAFDAETGARLWSFTAAPEQNTSATILATSKPVARDDLVVDDLGYNTLGVFNAATGELVHKIDGIVVPRSMTGLDLSTALAGDRLLALDQKGDGSVLVKSIQLGTGSQLWQTEYSDAPGGEEIARSDRMLAINERSAFVAPPQQLNAYALDSGERQFQRDLNCNDIQAVGPVLYCKQFASLIAIDTVTGKTNWEFSPPGSDLISLTGLQANDQVVYVTDTRRENPEGAILLALDPANGKVLWQKPIWDESGDAPVLWSIWPAASQEAVFALSRRDRRMTLMALSAADGSLQWQIPTWEHHYSPVYANGRVFLIDRVPRWRSWLAQLNPAWH